MSATVTVTGNLGRDPELRYLQSGKPVCDLNIAATYQRLDKQTNQWEDQGDPLWLRASFWEQEAERLAGVLHKGQRVTVTGVLVQTSWTNQQGQAGTTLELRYPRFLGVIPKAQNTGYGSQDTSRGAFTTPTAQTPQADPWATHTATQTPQQGDYNERAPF